jgi:uncharacterized protein
MIALISPAKSMEKPAINSAISYSQPIFKDEMKTIVAALKKLKKVQLMELMSISDKLAELNVSRFKAFNHDFTLENGAAPAITSFTGDVYLGLDARSFSQKELLLADEKILILSGLYGIIKPLDLILPYRLEMGSSIALGKKKNLYHFWGSTIADRIEEKMKASKSQYLINLASDEYFKAVGPHFDDTKIIHINFMEEKNGKWTFISFNAKKARGLMCRYIVKTKAKSPDMLKGFDYEDYQFNASLSKANEWIFTRKFIPISEKRQLSV